MRVFPPEGIDYINPEDADTWNYRYHAMGRIISNRHDGIARIEYNAYNKCLVMYKMPYKLKLIFAFFEMRKSAHSHSYVSFLSIMKKKGKVVMRKWILFCKPKELWFFHIFPNAVPWVGSVSSDLKSSQVCKNGCC